MAKLRIVDVNLGDKVRMANDAYNANGYSKGDVVVITYKQGNSINVIGGSYNQAINVPLSALTKSEETIEEIEKEIEEQQFKIDENKSKLDWMQTTGNKVYDELEFKVWNTLKTLNSASTDEQKAKVIAKLIKK